MEPNERERFAEELLDAALRQYSVEPRAGLEQRVLAGVRAKENEATQPWWRWQWAAVAAAAALVLALGIYLAMPSRDFTPKPELAEKPATPPAQEVAPPPAVGPVSQVPPREIAKTHRPTSRREAAHAAVPAHPKLDVFPAPAPISEQEQVALFYARRAPAQALVAAAEAASRPLTSLHIEEIQVAPLAEPQGTGENPQDGIQK